jgi:transcriptional regulator with XRE-family HTH domain
MLQIHEKIERARVSAGLSQKEMAEKLGIKRSTYQYWEKITPGLDKINQVARVLKLPNDYFFGKSDETEQAPKQDNDEKVSSTMDAIRSLVESNKALSDANKTLADAHLIIAKGNEELIQLAKGAIANVAARTPVIAPAIFPQLLVTLAEIGSGKKWKSVEEAAAVLNKRFADALPHAEKADIQIGSGR